MQRGGSWGWGVCVWWGGPGAGLRDSQAPPTQATHHSHWRQPLGPLEGLSLRIFSDRPTTASRPRMRPTPPYPTRTSPGLPSHTSWTLAPRSSDPLLCSAPIHSQTPAPVSSVPIAPDMAGPKSPGRTVSLPEPVLGQVRAHPVCCVFLIRLPAYFPSLSASRLGSSLGLESQDHSPVPSTWHSAGVWNTQELPRVLTEGSRPCLTSSACPPPPQHSELLGLRR